MEISKTIIKLAKQSIQDEFDYKNSINTKKITEEFPALKKDGASFVTLTQNGKLRGCIGSLLAQRPLVEDIISNAKNAAFRDPRFPKLSKEEFLSTDIEVSILTKPMLLKYKDKEDLKRKIRPYIDGVILKLGSNQATFLPQVWEELNDFESFFHHLLLKAGLSSDNLKNPLEIYTYEVIKYD